MNLYKSEHARKLEESFAQPSAIYRGMPFWSWNAKLEEGQLLRQIDLLEEMGMGGFHMHARLGLDTEYLGPDFMKCVRACVDKAAKKGMYAWLYDEDRWPSGFAGGLVTREPKYRTRVLMLVPDACRQQTAALRAAEHGSWLARYAIRLSSGCLAAVRMIQKNEPLHDGEAGWTAYCVQHEPDPWFNGQAYLDTLSPEAVRRFVEVTHERYREVVGDAFGTTIPAIFTDEPQFSRKEFLARPEEEKILSIPYTTDFPESYRAAYNADFFASLPEVFWELPDGQLSCARYRYHDHVTERFARAFCDTVGTWCNEQGIALTGHMMEEPTLWSQTHMVGEAMRNYRSFQLPGIDMLCDAREYTTAKQAQSAAHQYGRSGVLSEIYGVTGWDFDFAGHKAQGDWQAALGISVRVHHLSWVSMGGEAKRDYPASIFYQSPWYKRYKIVEDHFARVNAALTRGRPVVRIGLVHPIESYWLLFGPFAQTADARDELEEQFRNTVQWLLSAQMDFDFICESLLPQQSPLLPDSCAEGFCVGEMTYDVVVIPPMYTIRASTLERLRQFAKRGGQVVFAGEAPRLVDACVSDDAVKLASCCVRVPFARTRLLAALDEVREIDIRRRNGGAHEGARETTLLYQLREEGTDRILFLCNTERTGGASDCEIRIRGLWSPELLDTTTGGIRPLPAFYDAEWTSVNWTFFPHGHLLMRLRPGRSACAPGAKFVRHRYAESELAGRLADRVPVSLSEPNSLVLDQAQWRLDDGPWQSEEEILRIGNFVIQKLELGAQTSGMMAQPWAQPTDEKVYGTLQLRIPFFSEVDVRGACLALEPAAGETVALDGVAVPVQPVGWWVDESIKTIALADFSAGEHELHLTIPLRKKFSLEWCYLLGDFGVRVAGRRAKLIAPVRELNFGDWTVQGLPFYTGNVTYHCSARSSTKPVMLYVDAFRGALVDVSVDGAAPTPLAFAPTRCRLPDGAAREIKIDLTLYGTRGNAFNPLHWTPQHPWINPGCWRSIDTAWCYEYLIKPAGILYTPVLAEQEL